MAVSQGWSLRLYSPKGLKKASMQESQEYWLHRQGAGVRGSTAGTEDQLHATFKRGLSLRTESMNTNMEIVCPSLFATRLLSSFTYAFPEPCVLKDVILHQAVSSWPQVEVQIP